jgi:chromosome segregation ATPase
MQADKKERRALAKSLKDARQRHIKLLKKVEKARARFEKRARKLQALEAEIAELTRRTFEPDAQRLGQAAGDDLLRPARVIFNPKSGGTNGAGAKQLEQIIGHLRAHGIRDRRRRTLGDCHSRRTGGGEGQVVKTADGLTQAV